MEELKPKTLERLFEMHGRFEDDVKREFRNVQEQIQGIYRKMDERDLKLDAIIERLDARLVKLEDWRTSYRG